MPAVRTEPMSFRPFSGHDEYFYVDLAQSARVNTPELGASSNTKTLRSRFYNRLRTIGYGSLNNRGLLTPTEYASECLPEPSVAKPSSSVIYASTPKSNNSGKRRTAPSSDAPKRRKTCNAFILFRSHAISEKLVTGCANMSEMSCRVAELWRSMSRDEQAPFYAKAAQEKTMAALGILPEPKPSRRNRARTTPRSKIEAQLRNTTDSPLSDGSLSPCSPTDSESSGVCSPTSSSSLMGPTPFVLDSSLYMPTELDIPYNTLTPSIMRMPELELSSPWDYNLLNGYNTDMTALPFTEPSPVPATFFSPCHSDEYGLGQLNDMLEQSFFDIFGM